MSVHRLVQHLLPPSASASHHLVPKTDEQGQATKTLLGKIFGMTGKRREMISLNGSGVEDPQAESLLERMAAGDKGDGEVGVGVGVEEIYGDVQSFRLVNMARGRSHAIRYVCVLILARPREGTGVLAFCADWLIARGLNLSFIARDTLVALPCPPLACSPTC